MTRRAALLVTALLIAAALAIRIVRIEDSAYYRPVNDAGSYLTLASQVANTGDYNLGRRPGIGAGGTRGPSAYFPPGFPYVLAAVDLLDGHTTRRGAATLHGARISQAVLGTAVVALTGLLAYELFGTLTGLVALTLAAVYPVLIELSGILVAENLMTALVLAATWAAVRARRSPQPYRWIAGAGLLSGLAALTHENAVLILLPLGFAAWHAAPRALVGVSALLAAAALTIAPWTARNAIVMHRLIPISDETGITLVGTYNPASALNAQLTYKWRIFYGIPGERELIARTGRMTEPQLGDELQSQALHYITDHPTAPFVVAYHNTLRLLELAGAYAWRASAKAMGLRNGIAHTGIVSFWILCGLALAGAFTQAARAAPRWLWGIPLLLAVSVVLVNVETPRFREPVDPYLILLTACAVAAAARRVSGVAAPGLRRAPVGRDGGPAVPAGDAELVEMGQRLA